MKRVLSECWEYAKFQGRGFGWTWQEKVNEYEMQTMDLAVTCPISSTPPWLFPEVRIDLSILENKKKIGNQRM